MVVQPYRRRDRCEQRGHDRLGQPRRLLVHQQQHEFVAPQAGHGVALAQSLGQARGHRLQQAVAHRVAQRIVDELEIIQVDEHNPDRVGVARRKGDRLVEPVVEQGAVGQERERVMVGLVFQLGLVTQRG